MNVIIMIIKVIIMVYHQAWTHPKRRKRSKKEFRVREHVSWQSRKSHRRFLSSLRTSALTAGHRPKCKAQLTLPSQKAKSLLHPRRLSNNKAARKGKFTVECSTEIPTLIRQIKTLERKLTVELKGWFLNQTKTKAKKAQRQRTLRASSDRPKLNRDIRNIRAFHKEDFPASPSL